MSLPRIHFRRVAPGVFRARLRRTVARAVLVEIGLTLPAGYLERFCRYARRRETEKPPTFLNTQYAERPPGRRVGPWPGWRGIPELPVLTLESGGRLATGKYYFLGDEEVEGELRVMFPCEAGLNRSLTLRVPDPRFGPRRAQIVVRFPDRAAPRPVRLRAPLRGGFHPRLVLDEAGVARLRREIRGPRAPHWRRLLRLVRQSWRLPYATTPEGKVLPGPERLTGADRALVAAMVALLRPDRRTVAWAQRTYFAYLRETKRPDFGPLGIDTQSGEVLYILCVAFDWLAPTFTPVQRARARRRLWEVAEICRRHLGPERRDYAQAHYLGCGLGLLAFSFLFWEDHPQAPAWAAELRGALERVLAMAPRDGFFPHGLNLWIYEHGFLLRWLELFRHCAGEDLWHRTPYLAAASSFRAAATSPDGRQGVTFGDPQYRVTGDSWCHLLIANRTGAAAAQAIGERLLQQLPTGTDHRHAPPRRRVYELLWHSPAQRARPQGDGVQVFPDGGQVFVRRGDTLVTLRAGAPLGRQRRAAGEVGGYGHSDPCNGAVLVWRGETFLGSGPGPLYRRDTALHNLVTVDGRGQMGDGCVWYPDFLEDRFIPAGPRVTTRGGVTRIEVELAASYLPHLGVQRHRRIVEIARDGSLRGSDEIELKAAAEIAWHWHTWGRVRARGAAFAISGPGCRAMLTVVPEAGTQVRVQPEQFVAAYPHEGTVGTEVVFARFARRTGFRWRVG
ncbi:MAG: heparinase II/III family protein [Verrucomicrobia bacterium]|nr:heparinase II/III family protein [Verrucomicrobiota bacterium]